MWATGRRCATRTRRRFLREARLAARVHHPHIVSIYAVGEHEGNPYLAMEFIAGRTMAQIIRGAHKAGKSVAVCGEMAGDVKLTRVLLGFGLRQFSMHPAHLLSIKQQVLRTDIEEVTQLAG